MPAIRLPLIAADERCGGRSINDVTGRQAAFVAVHATSCATTTQEAAETARLIVRAANSHEQLLDMLYRVLPYIEDAKRDTAYKPGHVTALLRDIHGAIKAAEGPR